MCGVHSRFWEIDALRGIAIFFMVLFHFFYDMVFFGVFHVDVWSGPVFYIGRSAAILFIFLVGVSLTLSRSRSKASGLKVSFSKYLKRGFHIILWGMVFTLTSWVLFPDKSCVRCSALMVPLSYYISLLKYHFPNLISGLVAAFSGD